MPKKVFEISWDSPDIPDWINEEDVRRVLACSYREEANFRVKEIRPTPDPADGVYCTCPHTLIFKDDTVCAACGRPPRR